MAWCLYGLCKVHKAIVDVCPLFRLILSAIETPTYEIAKFLALTLSCLTINEFIVKDSSFAKEIVEQDNSFYMGTLDMDSLWFSDVFQFLPTGLTFIMS